MSLDCASILALILGVGGTGWRERLRSRRRASEQKHQNSDAKETKGAVDITLRTYAPILRASTVEPAESVCLLSMSRSLAEERKQARRARLRTHAKKSSRKDVEAGGV